MVLINWSVAHQIGIEKIDNAVRLFCSLFSTINVTLGQKSLFVSFPFHLAQTQTQKLMQAQFSLCIYAGFSKFDVRIMELSVI